RREQLLLLAGEGSERLAGAVFVLDTYPTDVLAGVTAAVEGHRGDVSIALRRAHIGQVRESAEAAEGVDQAPADGGAVGTMVGAEVERLGFAVLLQGRSGDFAQRNGRGYAATHRRDHGGGNVRHLFQDGRGDGLADLRVGA